MAKKSVKTTAKQIAVVSRRMSKRPVVRRVIVELNVNGCPYWWMQANNGECLSPSEAYSSMAECRGTADPLAYQLGVPVVDRTKGTRQA